MKKPKIHLPKESRAPKCSQSSQTTRHPPRPDHRHHLGRHKLLTLLNSILRLNSKNNHNQPLSAGSAHSWPLEVYLFSRTGL